MLLLFVIQDHNDLKMQSKKKKKNGNRDCQNQPDIIKKRNFNSAIPC